MSSCYLLDNYLLDKLTLSQNADSQELSPLGGSEIFETEFSLRLRYPNMGVD